MVAIVVVIVVIAVANSARPSLHARRRREPPDSVLLDLALPVPLGEDADRLLVFVRGAETTVKRFIRNKITTAAVRSTTVSTTRDTVWSYYKASLWGEARDRKIQAMHDKLLYVEGYHETKCRRARHGHHKRESGRRQAPKIGNNSSCFAHVQAMKAWYSWDNIRKKKNKGNKKSRRRPNGNQQIGGASHSPLFG